LVEQNTGKLKAGGAQRKTSSVQKLIYSLIKEPSANNSFFEGRINKLKLQVLIDTGNLANSDLLDKDAFDKAYSPYNRPKITRLNAPIKAAGGTDLDSIGTVTVSLQIADVPEPWMTRMVVVRNLGVPAILCARSIQLMPMHLFTGSGIAHVGPYGHKISLQPYSTKRSRSASRPSSPREEVQEELQPEYVDAYAIRSVTIPPNSIALAKVTSKQDEVDPMEVGGKSTVVYEPCSKVLERTQLVSADVVASPFEETGRKTRVFFIPLANFTNQQRRVREGQVVGRCAYTDKAPPSLYSITRPLKLKPLPDLKNLTSHKKILEALDDYVGPLPTKSLKETLQLYKKVSQLFEGQVEKNPDLTKDQKTQVIHLLARFIGIVSKSQYDVGCTKLLEFTVDTGDAKPIKDRTRPLNPAMVENLRQHLNEQVKEQILAPGDGPWASALVPVRKKSGQWRYAVDYRRLNNVTVTDSYPIAHQLMATASEEFGKSKYFISVDLAGAYLAVPVEKESQDKLAVTTCEGLFKCLRMPFGAKNACGCYARLMRLIFTDMMDNRESISFFDDHLIPCPSFLEGLFRFAKFLSAIEKANLRISPTKSKLFVQKVDWLGFEATAGALLPSDTHIKKVKDWPTPKDAKELASFYGLASYHRKFIRNFAKLAKPLKDVEKQEEFLWTKEAEEAFRIIKKALISKPVLAHPDFSSDRPFILNTDASDWAIGAELSQVQPDGTEKAIAYASNLLNRAESNYSTTRKELLAVVKFMNEFRYFLLGRFFKVRTDHSALQWLRSSMSLTGQLMRWSEQISDFDFVVEHRPGRKHQNADSLSRYPYPGRENNGPKLTKKDKEMYAKCGVKPPTSGSLGRKLYIGSVFGMTTRSGRKIGQSIEIDPEDDEMEKLEPEIPEQELKNDQELTRELPDASLLDEQRLIGQDNADHREWTDLDDAHPKNTHKDVQRTYNMIIEQRKDSNLNEITNWVRDNTKPKRGELINPILATYARHFDQLKIKQDILYLQEGERLRLCIPVHLIADMIRVLHQHPMAGHIGVYRTYIQAKQSFYWPNMHGDIEKAIAGCTACIKAKDRKAKKHVPMGQTSTAVKQRMRHFYADLVGPWFPQPLPGKNQYLLTLVDAVTKFPEAYPIHQAKTENIIKCLLTEFLPRYGTGMTITTDNGSQFVSALFKKACQTLGVVTSTTQAYEPHSNPVERMHRTLENAIRALMAQEGVTNPQHWDLFVPAALASIRQSPLSNLPYTPHYLLYGEEPVIPAQILTQHTSPNKSAIDASSSIQRLHGALEKVQELQLKNHLKNKEYYDKKVKDVPISKGDWVFVHQQSDPTKMGSLRKLSTHRQGPYLVLDVINQRQVKILRKEGRSKRHPHGRDVEEIVSRDRLLKVPPWDLSVLPSPLGWSVSWNHSQWRKQANSTYDQNSGDFLNLEEYQEPKELDEQMPNLEGDTDRINHDRLEPYLPESYWQNLNQVNQHQPQETKDEVSNNNELLNSEAATEAAIMQGSMVLHESAAANAGTPPVGSVFNHTLKEPVGVNLNATSIHPYSLHRQNDESMHSLNEKSRETMQSLNSSGRNLGGSYVQDMDTEAPILPQNLSSHVSPKIFSQNKDYFAKETQTGASLNASPQMFTSTPKSHHSASSSDHFMTPDSVKSTPKSDNFPLKKRVSFSDDSIPPEEMNNAGSPSYTTRPPYLSTTSSSKPEWDRSLPLSPSVFSPYCQQAQGSNQVYPGAGSQRSEIYFPRDSETTSSQLSAAASEFQPTATYQPGLSDRIQPTTTQRLSNSGSQSYTDNTAYSGYTPFVPTTTYPSRTGIRGHGTLNTSANTEYVLRPPLDFTSPPPSHSLPTVTRAQAYHKPPPPLGENPVSLQSQTATTQAYQQPQTATEVQYRQPPPVYVSPSQQATQAPLVWPDTSVAQTATMSDSNPQATKYQEAQAPQDIADLLQQQQPQGYSQEQLHSSALGAATQSFYQNQTSSLQQPHSGMQSQSLPTQSVQWQLGQQAMPQQWSNQYTTAQQQTQQQGTPISYPQVPNNPYLHQGAVPHYSPHGAQVDPGSPYLETSNQAPVYPQQPQIIVKYTRKRPHRKARTKSGQKEATLRPPAQHRHPAPSPMSQMDGTMTESPHSLPEEPNSPAKPQSGSPAREDFQQGKSHSPKEAEAVEEPMDATNDSMVTDEPQNNAAETNATPEELILMRKKIMELRKKAISERRLRDKIFRTKTLVNEELNDKKHHGIDRELRRAKTIGRDSLRRTLMVNEKLSFTDDPARDKNKELRLMLAYSANYSNDTEHPPQEEKEVKRNNSQRKDSPKPARVKTRQFTAKRAKEQRRNRNKRALKATNEESEAIRLLKSKMPIKKRLLINAPTSVGQCYCLREQEPHNQ
jgi:hypothetical protein